MSDKPRPQFFLAFVSGRPRRAKASPQRQITLANQPKEHSKVRPLDRRTTCLQPREVPGAENGKEGGCSPRIHNDPFCQPFDFALTALSPNIVQIHVATQLLSQPFHDQVDMTCPNDQATLDWAKYEAEILDLFIIQNKTLNQVMAHMEEKHNFQATYVNPILY